MRPPVSFLAASVSALGAASFVGAQPAPQDSPLKGVADLYAPGVALVRAEHQTHTGAATRTGPGFLIGPGKFVTTRALLFDCASATIVLDGGQTLPVTKVIAEDLAVGLVIAVAEVPPELRRGLALSPVSPIVGEEALVIGPATKPGEPLPEHTVAAVTVGERLPGSPGLFVLKGEVPAALAGSPVLSATGQVVGVVAGAPTADEGPPAAVPADRLVELRETAGLALAEWAGGARLPVPAEDGAGAKPHSVEQRPDGSVLVDKRFLLTGEGTREKPYKVTWDLLLSAMEDYVPKQGRKNLPERITMLAGKYIEITGNVAFPMMVDQPEELLSMMNPWDGCCIGVPPTPYDAVEVHLAEPVAGQVRFATFGAVAGRLRVEPQLVGNWLVGLYVMDDATLTPAAFGGFAP
jgi:hypothetical protein